jgi:hypothetical protein
MSEQDLAAGARWSPEIARHLSSAKFGIICVTAENQAEPWLVFEAGAISASLESRVCVLLLGMTESDLRPPLSQFQAKRVDSAGVRDILKSLKEQLGDQAPSDIDLLLSTWWPNLHDALSKIPSAIEQPEHRKERHILEEILGIVRQQDRVSERLLELMQPIDLTSTTNWQPYGPLSNISRYRWNVPGTADLQSLASPAEMSAAARMVSAAMLGDASAEVSKQPVKDKPKRPKTPR